MLAGGSRKLGGARRGGEESRGKGREREREVREGFSCVSRAERVPLPSSFLSNSNRLIVRSVPTKEGGEKRNFYPNTG